MLRAVVYDLDGTLVDSLPDLAAAVNAMRGELGLASISQAVVRGYVGEGESRLVLRALEGDAARLEDGLARWRRAYEGLLLEQTRPYAGIPAVLALPPPHRAVLTNKPGRFARRILDGLALSPAFEHVVGGDEAPRKPDPTGLLQLCAGWGAAPTEVLLVGDSLVDVATGAAAGVPVCAVTWGLGDAHALRSSGAAWVAESPGDLHRLLERLSNG